MTHRRTFSRFMAVLLAVMVLAQSVCLSAFATVNPVHVIIPANSTADELNDILTQAFPDANAAGKGWEYQCIGKSKLGVSSDLVWGSVAGFTSETGKLIKTEYTHPSLASNSDGSYQVRVSGTTAPEYTVIKAAKAQSTITLKSDVKSPMFYHTDNTVDFDAVCTAIFQNAVASTTPELTAKDVTIEYEATSKINTKKWVSLEGATVNLVEYPAMTEGIQNIRISWNGNTNYYGFDEELQVEITSGKQPSFIRLNDNVEVPMVYDDNGNADIAATKSAIFSHVVASSMPELTLDNVVLEYYATSVGAVGSLAKYAWVPLEGGTVSLVPYPAISEGAQKIRIRWDGNSEYEGYESEAVTVILTGRQNVQIKQAENPVAALNSPDLKAAILHAVVESSTPALTAGDVSMKYQVKTLGIATWNDLSELNETGTYTIQISWGGNAFYYPFKLETDVKIVSGKQTSFLQLKDNTEVPFVYDDNGVIDIQATKAAIYSAVVDVSEPELTLEDVTLEYYATLRTGAVGSIGHEWVALEGTTLYPAISEGSQKIRISWNGNDTYDGFGPVEATITLTSRPDAPYDAKDPAGSVKLSYNEDQSVDYSCIETDVFSAIVASSAVLTPENVTIEYYATASTGAVGDLGHAWVPLTGGKVNALTYPAIPVGTQKIRITYPGSKDYAPTVIDATIEILGRTPLTFQLKEAPYAVSMIFTADQEYDYNATARAICDAVIESTDPVVDFSELTVEYNVGTDVLPVFKPLNNRDTLTKKFTDGTWTIRLSWGGSKDYAPSSVTVAVSVEDNRIASEISLKSGVSFTYSKDVDAIKQAILDSVIDWDKSALPSKETISLDDFTFTYQAQLSILDGVSSDLADKIVDQILGNGNVQKAYVPFEGKSYELAGQTLGKYPPIGAGEQQIRVAYKGNANYKASAETDGTVTIQKANVKVSVKSSSMHVSEAENGLSLVTTDPEDDFNVYVIYAGITSNVTTAVYLELPDRYTSNSTLITMADKILVGLGQPTLTSMLQNGITVGELRNLLNASELIEALEKLGIDTGSLGKIITVINKLPSIGDNLRIAFGTPNKAGIYAVTAVTENKNYNTGVGMGALVLKADKAQLVWKQSVGKKISVSDVQATDFMAELQVNGQTVQDQSSVHVLYSGFTSKWKIYSSTTTPPTEPGRYTMTVVVLGGNYLASPITRSFQITK